MSTSPADDRVLTIRDLMERWDVQKYVVLRHIENDQLPHFEVGTGSAIRRWHRTRFRLSAVIAWERARETILLPPEAPAVIDLAEPPRPGQDHRVYFRELGRQLEKKHGLRKRGVREPGR